MNSETRTALDMADGDGPIAELRRIHEAQRELERSVAEQVRRARRQGHSWHAIGSALEISKQAVHKKFGRR